jgi:hypothetical protein
MGPLQRLARKTERFPVRIEQGLAPLDRALWRAGVIDEDNGQTTRWAFVWDSRAPI